MNSLYHRLGGDAAIEAAVEHFYDRVLQDPLLGPIFADVPMARMRAHQSRFLAAACGGPNIYEGRDLGRAHAGLIVRFGLGDAHFDAVQGHLQAALASLGVPVDLRTEVQQKVETLRPLVLGREVALSA